MQFEASTRPPPCGQRRHWKAKLVGLLRQVPVVAVSVSPWIASPEIRGSVLFTGAACDCADPKVGTSKATATAIRATSDPPSHRPGFE